MQPEELAGKIFAPLVSPEQLKFAKQLEFAGNCVLFSPIKNSLILAKSVTMTTKEQTNKLSLF
jgi:hypothetical protein